MSRWFRSSQARFELKAPGISIPAQRSIGLVGLDARRRNCREAGSFEPLNASPLLVGGQHHPHAVGAARRRVYVTDDSAYGALSCCGIAQQDDASSPSFLDNRLLRVADPPGADTDHQQLANPLRRSHFFDDLVATFVHGERLRRCCLLCAVRGRRRLGRSRCRRHGPLANRGRRSGSRAAACEHGNRHARAADEPATPTAYRWTHSTSIPVTSPPEPVGGHSSPDTRVVASRWGGDVASTPACPHRMEGQTPCRASPA